MLVGRYFQLFALSLTTLLVFEEIPVFKTIGPGSSEASQLLSVLSEFVNGAKEVIVEMLARPSGFFHVNGSNRSPIILALPPPPPPPATPSSPPSPPPLPPPHLPPPASPPESPTDPPPEPPPESPPEPLPEPTPLTDNMSHFLRMDGSKIILELDLERVPGFDAMREAAAWVAYWFGVLFSGGPRDLYWLRALVPALGFFAGLGYGLAGWCRWCLSRKNVPQPAEEKVEQTVVIKHTEPRDPADAYHESRLSQSYMMPLNFQNVPDPRLLRVSVPIAAIKLEQAGDVNLTMDRIAKKEEDADPLIVPSSFSDSSWYSPGSPTSPTQSNGRGLDLPSFDGFQPMPQSPHPNGLPDTLMGSFPLIVPPPREPPLPRFSDPWSNYTPEDPVELS